MKLVTLLALASMAATAAPAFADSIVPGSDAAFYSQATPAPIHSSTSRYGMPRTAATGGVLATTSDGTLVPGSDAAFEGPAPKAPVMHKVVQPAVGIDQDMVPGSDAAFLN